MKHKRIEDWTSSHLVMVIISACFVDFLIGYIGPPPPQIVFIIKCNVVKFEDIVRSLLNMCVF